MQKQMTPVVGVPKREPCQRCGNPVFLAERLSVGKALYHRTCLRCARCNSQLTLGSFYETEMDGVFCCETCPDEETKIDCNDQLSIASSSSTQDRVVDYLQMDPTRKSFSEKLAMFQTNDRALLQKSLSDEEKSKSLKRLSEMYARNVSNFTETIIAAASTETDTVSGTSINCAEILNDDDNHSDSSSDTDSDNFEPTSIVDPHETVATTQAPTISTKPPPIASKANVLNKIYGSAATSSPIKSMQRNISIEKDTEKLKNSTTEFANEMQTTTTQNESSASQTQPSIAANTRNLVDNEISPSHSIANNNNANNVRAIADNNAMPSNHQQPNSIPNVTKDETVNCNESSEVTNNVAEQFTPNNSIINEIENNSIGAANESNEYLKEALEPNGDAAAISNEQLELVNSESTEIELPSQKNATEQDDAIVSKTTKPVPVKRAIIFTETIAGDEQPPTPMRRKHISNAEISEDSGLSAACNGNETHTSIDIDRTSTASAEKPECSTSTAKDKEYPVDLNPFGDSEDDEEEQPNSVKAKPSPVNLRKPSKMDNSNPFDSSDDEIELLKETPKKLSERKSSAVRLSTNPFGSDTEDEDGDGSSISSKRTPVPTPRKMLSVSMSLRNSSMHGSVTSLASTTHRHRKGRAPAAPTGAAATDSKSSSLQHSATSSPSHSNRATPMLRKKRPAPLPPPMSLQSNELSASMLCMTGRTQLNHSFGSCSTLALDDSINHFDTSINSIDSTADTTQHITTNLCNETSMPPTSEHFQRKLIPIDASLLEDMPSKSITDLGSEQNVCYRRTIVPTELECTAETDASGLDQQQCNDRQWEKMKQNKESQNKNRQSQNVVLLPGEDPEMPFGSNKSSYGKWKRRKGPAPSLPIPPRKVLQMLPLEDIRHELEVIEVQQQGLEKQGVQLEKMIRERCEGNDTETTPLDEFKPNSKEVEDLILQLFELVNEKNELFRRQAELMYLRRQHRLEQEQADIEYEIRVLMAQPECNKTDSDKSREETLISRLLDVVQLRNEVIESLDMDRRREAEEDQSIKERMELHTAQRDKKLTQQRPTKLSKKEKKKQKESKKLAKLKKIDAEKDADESEMKLEHSKEGKKKKKKFIF